MAYAPNVYNSLLPTDATDAETAQAEFRAIKGFYVGSSGRQVGAVSTTNSTATKNALSLTIPANSLGTTRKLEFTWRAEIFNTTGSVQGINFAVFFGGSQILGLTPGSFAITTGSTFVTFRGELVNINSAGQQSISGEIILFVDPAAINAPASMTAVGTHLGAIANVAIDTTVDQVLLIQYALGVASANYSMISLDTVVKWI